MTTTTETTTIRTYAIPASILSRAQAERLRHLLRLGIGRALEDAQAFGDEATRMAENHPESADVMLGMRREFERYVNEGEEISNLLDYFMDGSIAVVVQSPDEIDEILVEAYDALVADS
jgi:hypothetical protein